MSEVREFIEKNGLPYHFRENVKTGKNEYWWVSGIIKSNGDVGRVEASFSRNGWSYGAEKREEPAKVKAAIEKLEKKIKAFREIHEEEILAWIKKEQTPRVIISVHKPRTVKPDAFDEQAARLVATHKAAPELLATLKEGAATLTYGEYLDWIKKARAAIAKATGAA